jgi:gliding motility-associatede transport system auxiliary component
MKVTENFRRGLLLQNLLFVALLLACVGLIGSLARAHRVQWDLTSSARHTLSQASVDILKSLAGPVTITAYATEQDPRLGDVRKLIRDFLAPYQRVKPDLVLHFVDPTEQPKLAQAAGVQSNGEMVVEYGTKREHLTLLSEQALTNLLTRVARDAERLVMYLDGHGERKLDGAANHDLGEFGRQLRNKGFRLAGLNLPIAQEVPANVSVLVISNPRVPLLEGEVDKLLAYADRGGNLLWLIDPETVDGLQPLAEKLRINLMPGTVVDPAAQQLSAPATWALGGIYGNHAITRDFSLVTVFPFARQIVVEDTDEWSQTPLVDVAPRGWVETGSLEGSPKFDKNRDTPGPVTIAEALSRNRKDRDQRVVVVGNGAFLSNAYLGNGGNLDLGINMVNWLAGDERLIAIQPRPTFDSGLSLTRNAALVITVGLLIVLPIVFLVAGVAVWWQRRRR